MKKALKSIAFTIMILFCNSIFAKQLMDPLPSWNEGAAKSAILNFIKMTTKKQSAYYVPLEERIATFDQDGTLWVEQPIYTQLIFAFDRIVELAPKHPEWQGKEPFKSLIAKDKTAIAKFNKEELEEIIEVTHAGMTVEAFQAIVKKWLDTAKNPRWNQKYTHLIYKPMLEVLQLFQANGYKTYIVTGGGQDFVRVYSDQVYKIAPERVIGSAFKTQYSYDKKGNGILMRSPQILLNDNFSGKPEDIYLFAGARPCAAFGNSTGDQQMLEYTQAGKGAHLMMLVHHDDADREYAYGPNSKVGTFSNELMTEAKKKGWSVISMKNDWKQIFSFDS